MLFKRGDRVRRKDGGRLFGGHSIGIVGSDQEKGQNIIFVTTHHSLYSNSESHDANEMEKVKEFEITIDGFLSEMQMWLISEGVYSDDPKVKEAYKKASNYYTKLRGHIKC